VSKNEMATTIVFDLEHIKDFVITSIMTSIHPENQLGSGFSSAVPLELGEPNDGAARSGAEQGAHCAPPSTDAPTNQSITGSRLHRARSTDGLPCGGHWYWKQDKMFEDRKRLGGTGFTVAWQK
jgi:hypothetical protein